MPKTVQITVQLCSFHMLAGGSDVKESSCIAGDLGREDPLEKEMATHSSILALRSPWTEELGTTVHGVTKSWTQMATNTLIHASNTMLKILHARLQQYMN